MFKKQALVVFVSALAFTNVAQALGLGDIELNSNLNEPLDAQIELLQLRGLTAGEILPTLASNDAFQRAGVDRSFFLSNIQFNVSEDEKGELVISLSTRQPVREPFLNFLVEVNWPGGRLLKEYTLLLDPPVFDTGTTGDSLAIDAATGSDETTELSTTTRASGTDTVSEVQPSEVKPRKEDLPPGQYRVQRNDTLWVIANNVAAGEGYRTQQVMLAIQDLNPDAFLNNNINRLKAGSLLNLPSEAQIAARTVQQAINEVRMQNEGMAPKLRPVVAEQSEVQLSATESTSSALPQGDGERDPDGYLEVAPADDTQGASAGGEPSTNNAEVERLQNELAIAAELNDQFERENKELESRLNQLEEQIAIMQRLLNVQGSNAAALQQQLAEQQAAQSAAEQGDAGAAQPQAVESGTEAETATPVARDEPTQSVDSDSAAAPDYSAQTAPSQQQSQPAQQQPASQPTAEPGILGFIKQTTAPISNWVMASVTNMIIAGAGLLIVLLLPSFIRSRLNRNDDAQSELATVADADLDHQDFSADFDDDLLGGFDEEDTLADMDAQDDERSSDAIMEAEMYMAYQKYEQAEEKLKSALAEEPGRADIGLKLLEVYAETGNATAFDELAQRLSLTADQKNQVHELRERMPMTGGTDDFSMDLDDDMDLDFGEDEEDEGAHSLDELEQDLKVDSGRYDLSDFESESEAKEPAKNKAKAPEPSLGGREDDLDFSLDLDELDIPDADSSDDRKASGLDFDMGDLGLDETESSESKGGDSRDREASSLDFTLDEDDLGSFDSDFDFELDETKKPSEPELPTLDTFDEGEFDFASLDDKPVQRAKPDELPTDDSLTQDSAPVEEEDEPKFDLETTDERETARPSQSKAELEESELRELADALPGGVDLGDDEFDFLSGSDEASTKLDLARAYIEMDDKEGARDILEEVALEGTDQQRQQAKMLMDQM